VKLISVRTAPTFRRFQVDSSDEVVRVDVAVDAAPMLEAPYPLPDGIRSLSLRDQRANKIVTLLGRSELRDLVDLFFLELAGWPLLDGLDDAAVKDSGLDLAWLAWAVRQIDIRILPGLLVPVDLEELRAFRDRISEALLDKSGARP
jgi:hypothetical protein